ncbi:MAG: hypothetical protein MMC23_007187 [Stictis urceolatum]|nr:hypothetical protein [Stictis urceolata]
MLEDLKAASREYKMENRALQDRYREGSQGQTRSPKGSNTKIEVSYEDSETRRRNDPSISHGSYSGSSSSGYPPVGSPYSESSGPYPPIPAGYPAGSSYSSGPNYASGAGQYPPSAYTMAPNMSGTPSYANPSDPRYQSHYTYAQPSRGEYAQPERYYAPGPGYAEPPRSRGEPLPQGYPPFARAPTDPREYGYDTEMGGTHAPPSGYAPPRGNAPSPYDGARDPYPSSRAAPDPYSGGSRRR